MQISTFPPVAEAKGRLLARTQPERAATELATLHARGVHKLDAAGLSYAAGIVRGLRERFRCQGCGEPLASDASRERGVCGADWDAGFRPVALPAQLDFE